ncbi:hypothetical protein D3C86_1897810 [compost metagenome]
MTQVLFAVEGEDVEMGVEVADPEFVAAVVEENGWNGAQVRTSLGIRGGFISIPVQALDSFLEADKG